MNEFTLFKYEMFPIVSCLAENSGCICSSFRHPITVHIFGRILKAPCKVYSFKKTLVELSNYYRSRSFVSTIRNARMRMTINCISWFFFFPWISVIFALLSYNFGLLYFWISHFYYSCLLLWNFLVRQLPSDNKVLWHDTTEDY